MLKERVEKLKESIVKLEKFQVENRALLAVLEKRLEDPDFWKDTEANKRLEKLRRELSNFSTLEKQIEEAEVMYDLFQEALLSYEDLEKYIIKVEETLEVEESKLLMKQPYDKNSAIVHIHAGAGGKDASDWAGMLENMYIRWASLHEYKVELLDRQEIDSGIKYSIFSIEGEYVFGRLRSEKGIHRLVRISPYDSNARRHTSFASLSISPEVQDLELKIDEKDLKIETFRSSGAGGQHVNTTDSAVRVTHIPSGLTASCSRERSQLKNREHAMKILNSRVLELELKKREEEMKKTTGEEKSISWGNQIRSYTLHPYKLVKDHRTGFEVSDVEAVLNGRIDRFIDAYLREDIDENKS